VYGKTKSLGEVRSPHVLHIRNSIIGPELGRSTSLLEWFLHQPAGAELQGFTHHYWNGVTTLQFAQLCAAIIENDAFDSLRQLHHVLHNVPNSTVTKAELLQIFAKAFKRQVKIQAVSNIGPKVDRTVASQFSQLSELSPSLTMAKAIQELATYLKKHHLSVFAN
jgi:dTDP-4-dehydrorhamnose reductase